MAEPHTQTEAQKTTQRENAQGRTATSADRAPGAGENPSAAEPRAFADEGARTARQALESGAQNARAAMEGSRQVAEVGRQAGRNMAEAWNRTLDPFMAFQYDMGRWFDDLWRQTTGLPVQTPLRTARPMGGLGAASLFGLPAADLRETSRAYELAIELPGMTKDDIELSAAHDTLTVIGHKAQEAEEGGGAYRVAERRYGRFERSFPLPDDINPSAIKASFQDGLLRITLPKTEEAAQRRTKIDIK